MLLITLTAVTLSVFLSNAQDVQTPQTQTSGLSSPVLRKVSQRETVKQHGKFAPDKSDLSGPLSSAVQRCAVEKNERVVCGESDITPAQCVEISCCYDAQGCFYAKAVTLQCTRDGQFILVVSRDATLPRISLGSIHLLGSDPSGQCVPLTTTSSFAFYQFPVRDCGTKVIEEDNSVIYENIMSTEYEVDFGPRGSIKRDSGYKMNIQCRYSGTSAKAVVVMLNTIKPSVSKNGQFTVQLRLSNEDRYSSYYTESDYPVAKPLEEPVYVEVRILRITHPNTTLILDNCWASNTPDPRDLPHWDLVVDGFPHKDNLYMTTILPARPPELEFPSLIKRFSLKTLISTKVPSLTPLQERLYIHCSVSVCERNCNASRSTSEKMDLEKILVSSGEVILVSSSHVSFSMSDEEVPQIWGYGLWTAGALTVIGFCGVLTTVSIQWNTGLRPQTVPV